MCSCQLHRRRFRRCAGPARLCLPGRLRRWCPQILIQPAQHFLECQGQLWMWFTRRSKVRAVFTARNRHQFHRHAGRMECRFHRNGLLIRNNVVRVAMYQQRRRRRFRNMHDRRGGTVYESVVWRVTRQPLHERNDLRSTKHTEIGGRSAQHHGLQRGRLPIHRICIVGISRRCK